jgi:hypothetical protein
LDYKALMGASFYLLSGGSMTDQTRLTSLIEVVLNTAIGFFVSMAIWPYVGSLYDIDYTVGRHVGITVIFTITSIARGYIVRRFFARNLHSAAVRIAKKILSRLPS